jgi:hypothetical protein
MYLTTSPVLYFPDGNTMTDLPAPSALGPMTPAFNRYGRVTFSSDRPDLTGRQVQVIYRSFNQTVEVWSPDQQMLYSMSGVSISCETGQRAVKKTPTWAIVLAVIGVFVFLLGLLFLLVKETTYVAMTSARFTDPNGRTLIVNVQ